MDVGGGATTAHLEGVAGHQDESRISELRMLLMHLEIESEVVRRRVTAGRDEENMLYDGLDRDQQRLARMFSLFSPRLQDPVQVRAT